MKVDDAFYQVLTLHTNWIETFSLKRVWKKSEEKCEQILVVAGESTQEPGPLALATSALTTELRQPTTSKTFTFYLYTVE